MLLFFRCLNGENGILLFTSVNAPIYSAYGTGMQPPPCRFAPDSDIASRKKNKRVARNETKRLVHKIGLLGQPWPLSSGQ